MDRLYMDTPAVVTKAIAPYESAKNFNIVAFVPFAYKLHVG